MLPASSSYSELLCITTTRRLRPARRPSTRNGQAAGHRSRLRQWAAVNANNTATTAAQTTPATTTTNLVVSCPLDAIDVDRADAAAGPECYTNTYDYFTTNNLQQQQLKELPLEVAPSALAQLLVKAHFRRSLISFARGRQQCTYIHRAETPNCAS